jgi:hypothetical protein
LSTIGSARRRASGSRATLYRERYRGFTVKHFHEHLVKDHGFGWGYTWTKLHLQWMGMLPPRAKMIRLSPTKSAVLPNWRFMSAGHCPMR